MKGWRTLVINGSIAVGTAAIGWAASINWADYLEPTTAVVITAAVNMVLRMVTTGPVGAK